jgi:predicted GNAT family N-acyltransferase
MRLAACRSRGLVQSLLQDLFELHRALHVHREPVLMSEARVLLVVVCGEVPLGDRIEQYVDEFRESGQLSNILPESSSFATKRYRSLEEAEMDLAQAFQNNPRLSVALVSDLLADRTSGRLGITCHEPTSAAKALHDRFKQCNFVSLAVVRELKRVPEIDHIVSRDFDRDRLLEIVELVLSKLEYLMPPGRRQLTCPIVIREISREHEILEYFQMRYHVYNIMGYLEEQCWELSNRIEMDACDKSAIHIGAFEICGVRERLVGTARIVQTKAKLTPSSRLTSAVASLDPSLQRELERSTLSMRLPIFHSSHSPRMNEIFVDVETHERNCGEISRIIVDREYRGTGLANLIVKYTVFKAVEKGMDPLLLECLDIHAPFYEKFGFRRVEGQGGKVVGVGKSMVAMELNTSPPGENDRFLVSGAEVFAETGRLCACRHRDCYGNSYQQYGSDSCPLA